MTEELLFAAFGALKGYLIPFVIFTLIGLLIAGRDAVRWSSDLLASVRSNIFLSIFNPMLAPLMMIGVVLTRQGYDAMGLPQTPLAFWDQVPLWLTILIWVIAIDFIDYWVHRLLHTRKVDAIGARVFVPRERAGFLEIVEANHVGFTVSA